MIRERKEPVGISTTEARAAQGKAVEGVADMLERLARAAAANLESPGYYQGYDKATAWWDGLANGFGGASGDLAGAIPPAAVLELVRLLRAEVRSSARQGTSPHLLALVRIIGDQAKAREAKQ